MKIGIFGVALKSVNYGVVALAVTQIRSIQNIARKCGCNISCVLFSDDNSMILSELSEYLDPEDIEVKYLVRLKTGLSGILQLKKDIEECDFIIDLTYGDSFSDIYGIKNFIVYSIPKIMTILSKKDLVLGPQTIGPFYNVGVKKTSEYLLKRVYYVAARDEISFDIASKHVKKEGSLAMTSDLAMELPYSVHKYQIDQSKFNVGLNVSLLMWENENKHSNINIKLSYRDLIDKLIQRINDIGGRVHLITHVYNTGSVSEIALAEKLHEKYPFTILAPVFRNPMDAKSYMSEMNLFIGSRMHATIGAFSAGVPVIPLSYSRKFEGLYHTIGYPYCIDCSKENIESAMGKICNYMDSIEILEKDRDKAFKQAKMLNEKYYDKITQMIMERI